MEIVFFFSFSIMNQTSQTLVEAWMHGSSAISVFIIIFPLKFECVFVKEGDKAKLKVIKTGIQDDTNIEIISGLGVDEEVITGPYNTVTKSLKNGDSVELKKEEKKEDIEEDS